MIRFLSKDWFHICGDRKVIWFHVDNQLWYEYTLQIFKQNCVLTFQFEK